MSESSLSALEQQLNAQFAERLVALPTGAQVA